MNGPFSAGQYALGILLGLALGMLFGYGNMHITKRAVKKNNGDGLAAVTATTLAAPAARSIRAHSRSVSPVVTISSTSKTRFPATRAESITR